MSYVAFQYAEALFALAFEEKQVDAVLAGLTDFVHALDDDVWTFLNHPKITKKDKKNVVGNVVTNSLLLHFIYVLIDNSRIDHIEDCLEEYRMINDNQQKVMKAVVYSKQALPKSDVQRLATNLGKKHNRKVDIENIVDSSIIGGLRIEYEGNIMDDTINRYLYNLKNNLTK